MAAFGELRELWCLNNVLTSNAQADATRIHNTSIEDKHESPKHFLAKLLGSPLVPIGSNCWNVVALFIFKCGMLGSCYGNVFKVGQAKPWRARHTGHLHASPYWDVVTALLHREPERLQRKLRQLRQLGGTQVSKCLKCSISLPSQTNLARFSRTFANRTEAKVQQTHRRWPAYFLV